MFGEVGGGPNCHDLAFINIMALEEQINGHRSRVKSNTSPQTSDAS
jgi:hypothetical protein